MKKLIFVLTALTVFSCKENEQKKENNTPVDESEILYYIEFINDTASHYPETTVKETQDIIIGSRYSPGKNEDSTWQGIVKITNEEALHPKSPVHHFRNYSEYTDSITDAYKILVTTQPQIGDSLLNFNIRMYKKLGHKQWQSVYNPGNFKYNHLAKKFNPDVAGWMAQRIVLLTFK